MNHPVCWRIGAMASAIALLGCLASLDAHAVTLGRVTVQSALGEALRAEVDLSDLSAEEATSFKVGVAGADAFRSSRLEYSAAAAALDVRLQKRPDGRFYLRLSSTRVVSEPFMNLVLDASSENGRVTRSYTMLFDPRELKASTSLTASAGLAPRGSVKAPVSSSLPQQETPISFTTPVDRPAMSELISQAVKASSEQDGNGDGYKASQVTVKDGDNAGKIASRYKLAGVSLNQMLVALLKSNPEAFLGENIHKMKSGVVLKIPSAQAAKAISPAEASLVLKVQNQEFIAQRQKLIADPLATKLADANLNSGNEAPDRAVVPVPVMIAANGQALVKDAVNEATKAAPTAATLPMPVPMPVPMPMPVSPASNAPGAAAALASLAANTQPVGAAAAQAGLPASAVAATLTASAASAQAALAALKADPKAATVVLTKADQLTQGFDAYLLMGGCFFAGLLSGYGFSLYRKRQDALRAERSYADTRVEPGSRFGGMDADQALEAVMSRMLPVPSVAPPAVSVVSASPNRAQSAAGLDGLPGAGLVNSQSEQGQKAVNAVEAFSAALPVGLNAQVAHAQTPQTLGILETADSMEPAPTQGMGPDKSDADPLGTLGKSMGTSMEKVSPPHGVDASHSATALEESGRPLLPTDNVPKLLGSDLDLNLDLDMAQFFESNKARLPLVEPLTAPAPLGFDALTNVVSLKPKLVKPVALSTSAAPASPASAAAPNNQMLSLEIVDLDKEKSIKSA